MLTSHTVTWAHIPRHCSFQGSVIDRRLIRPSRSISAGDPFNADLVSACHSVTKIRWKHWSVKSNTWFRNCKVLCPPYNRETGSLAAWHWTRHTWCRRAVKRCLFVLRLLTLSLCFNLFIPSKQPTHWFPPSQMIRFLKYCFAETSLLCSTASVLVESLFFLESLILEVRRSLGGKNFSEHLAESLNVATPRSSQEYAIAVGSLGRRSLWLQAREALIVGYVYSIYVM